MKIKLPFLLSFVLLCLGLGINAQTVIDGKLLDKTYGDGLIGATIVVKGTTIGTVTDFDGNFILKVKQEPPFTVVLSYVGYSPKEIEITQNKQTIREELEENSAVMPEVVVKGQRISDKQKSAPLTVESMDIKAIKSTPSDNFYDGLGNMKGVDLTAASLGFKIINTRGFNSTSPVRSLQIIDGVDNQSPGLNFSLGNFLGSPELDILKVDIIAGAASAFYGPNAFNGVIAMETKSPFYHRGFSAMAKVGERNMAEGSARYADYVKNKDGDPVLGYKVNAFYLRADDWVADNYDPVYETDTGLDNPGGYDAVNIYGDEYVSLFDRSLNDPANSTEKGLISTFHRPGYKEVDLVDYNTENYKGNIALHFRTKPKAKDKSPEIIVASNFGSGTTVYQGDNRFSLRNILFFQNRLEYRKKDKFFIRAYATHEDAGDSFDPYFTALKLTDLSKKHSGYFSDFLTYWNENIKDQVEDSGFPELEVIFDPETGEVSAEYDYAAYNQWVLDNEDNLVNWYNETRDSVNFGGIGRTDSEDDPNKNFFEPGTERFQTEFDRISSSKSNNEENGTLIYDKSALYHVHGEYIFEPSFIDKIIVGANARLYTPKTEGTVFSDTLMVDPTSGDTVRANITNFEYGAYLGLQQEFMDDRLKVNATIRLDKNQNFNFISTPAVSLVYKPRPGNFLRASFSAAIRNPTLSDQYLNFNVGPATLRGNLQESGDTTFGLIPVDDFLEGIGKGIIEFDDDPLTGIRPEKAKSLELGYRTTLFQKLYVDASYYYSIYNDFIGYKILVDAEFDTPENGSLLKSADVYRYAANAAGVVNTQGFSIGLNYYFAKYFMAAGNYSWNKLITEENDPIVPAFNTPEHKFNLSISGRDMKNWGFNINYKWIEGFLFEGSPQFTGFIPTYSLVDAQINYTAPKLKTTFKLGATNILNNKQFQTYGGPRIGRLAYFSVLLDLKKI